jgi:hypothetical protein
VLSVGEINNVQLTRLDGPSRFKALMDHTYRFRFLESLQSRASHFQRVVATAQVTPVMGVRRPAASPSIDLLVDRLVDDFVQ